MFFKIKKRIPFDFRQLNTFSVNPSISTFYPRILSGNAFKTPFYAIDNNQPIKNRVRRYFSDRYMMFHHLIKDTLTNAKHYTNIYVSVPFSEFRRYFYRHTFLYGILSIKFPSYIHVSHKAMSDLSDLCENFEGS